MARRLFFVPAIRRGMAELEGDEAQHLTRVLRVEAGQKYEISDNRSLYLAEVETARKSLVTFRVLESLPLPPPAPELTLLASLYKFERFEWMIEKACELGVSSVVPVVSARSEAGLEKAAAKRIARWRKIAVESCQQARRPHLIEISDPVPVSSVFAVQPGRAAYFCDERRDAPPLASMVSAPQLPALLAVGPEGGWTDEERSAFLAGGWRSVSLARYVLRAETAALAAAAVLVNGQLGSEATI